MRFNIIVISAVLLLSLSSLQASAAVNPDIKMLQQRWAEVNYALEGKEKERAFEALVDQADRVVQQYPAQAESWLWSGIIKSGYAGVKGGLRALSLARAAKKAFERAIELDGSVLSGSAYTSLGSLYVHVPGWPIGFGSDKKAEAMLLKGLELSPDGIDSNYFYGDYLMDQGDYAKALSAFDKALRAAPRPDRVLADRGRREEINRAIMKAKEQL